MLCTGNWLFVGTNPYLDLNMKVWNMRNKKQRRYLHLNRVSTTCNIVELITAIRTDHVERLVTFAFYFYIKQTF